MVLIRSIVAQLLLLAVVLTGCVQNMPYTAVPEAGPVISAEDYRMGTGDVISIRVYGGDEDLRLEKLRLDSSGTVTLPFGQFKVHGQTTKEVETAILETIKGRILKNPRVWVSVDEYRPFYVDGQVGRPGAYPYQPGLNVRRAVTIAGGFRERAALDKIFVIRENDKAGRPSKVDLNAVVAPGDTILVQESLF